MEKTIEWSIPIFVLDSDLYKAYDKVKHEGVVEAPKAKGVPRIAIAAWIRELRQASSVFAIKQAVRSDSISRTQSLLQGDSAAPVIFEATLDVPAAA